MLKGSCHSEKAKRKMSKAKKGKHYSPETEFKKGNKINLGRKFSEELKKKLSKWWFKKGLIPWNKRRKLSEETRRKIKESLKGRAAWNKESKMPEVIKKKLSEKLKGKHRSPRTEFKRGQNSGDKNPAKRVEIREKISKVKRGKQHFNQRGENHPHHWKGGVAPLNKKIRKSIEYKLWRGAVFTRDSWACQKCGKGEGKLNVHYLYNFADYPESRALLENGITLCRKCHREFHEIYGPKNNTKEKLMEFLNKINYAK